MTIANIIETGIAIIEKEINTLKDKTELLDRTEYDRLNEYLRVLVAIEKDRRLETKEQSRDLSEMTQEELEEYTLTAAHEIQEKRAKQK